MTTPGKSTMSWKTTVATVRGSAHERMGLPNQDACEYRLGDRSSALRTVLAISDGHGGARHFRSAAGSSLAANIAVTVLYEALLDEPAPKVEAARELGARIVAQWVEAVHRDFEANPFREEELRKVAEAEGPAAPESVVANPVLAYGATLLAAVVSTEAVLYLQLGDGDILAVDDAGVATRPLESDARLMANQTTSLCQPDASVEFRYAAVAGESPALILLSTDGYANSFRTERDFLQIGGDYLQMFREEGADAVSEQLPEILASASREGSGDDITLGAIYRQSGQQRPAPTAAPAQVVTRKRSGRWLAVAVACGSLAGVMAVLLAFRFGFAAKARTAEPTPEPRPPVVATKPVEERAWALIPSNGAPLIELAAGDRIAASALVAEGGDAPYAEVRRVDGALELVNLSEDVWTAQGGRAVLKGEGVLLSPRTTIQFRPGVSVGVRQVTATRAALASTTATDQAQ